jgi:hypothetical protein
MKPMNTAPTKIVASKKFSNVIPENANADKTINLVLRPTSHTLSKKSTPKSTIQPKSSLKFRLPLTYLLISLAKSEIK